MTTPKTNASGAVPAPAQSKADAMSVTVRIMARDYVVACPPEEHAALVVSADYLNQRMTGIRRRGKALGAERIAVMTALNLARELLALKGDDGVTRPDAETVARLTAMATDIDAVLDTPD